jgi:predicted nucleic-acid-binding Zn-ribbon protein
MATKKNKSIKKSNKSKKSKTVSRKSKIQKGGKTLVNNPTIKYTKGTANPKPLTCTKCDGKQFNVRTLTLGTKTKAFFNWGVFDNRFKVFTCTACAFVQMYSNNITCDGKACD